MRNSEGRAVFSFTAHVLCAEEKIATVLLSLSCHVHRSGGDCLKDPYASGMFKENPYFAKSDIRGKLVVVLQGMYEDRGLELIKPVSRCVKKYEIHELITSDEEDAAPGTKVNKIAYLGFVEILDGGVITTGDGVFRNGERIGFVAGYDETHMPNHLNIVLLCDKRVTGAGSGCLVGDEVIFRQTPALCGAQGIRD